MPLRKEVADLIDHGWGFDDPASQRAWAFGAMEALVGAACNPESHISIAAFLGALQVRRATGAHLAGFASALRKCGRSIHFDESGLVDTCGTGGGGPCFNISTAAALLAAAAGAKIAKHGNRGVTSSFGSADLLESFGIVITPDEAKLQECMAQTGFAFLFAPHFYEPLKHLRDVRTRIGVRTVFNQLGPLLNPAGAKRQIVGVFDSSLTGPTAEALAALGSEEAYVVRGLDGLDELSPLGPSEVCEVRQGAASEPREMVPEELGCRRVPPETVEPGSTDEEAKAKAIKSMTDADSDEFWAAAPTAVLAVSMSLRTTRTEALERVSEAARSGRVLGIIESLKEITR